MQLILNKELDCWDENAEDWEMTDPVPVIGNRVNAATATGYDAFDYSYDEKVLYGNESINWDATYTVAYTALGELAASHLPRLSTP